MTGKAVLRKNKPVLIAILISLMMVSASIILQNQMFQVIVLIPVILATAWVINRMNLQRVLLLTITLLLPFSAEISLLAGTMIRFPTEILILVAFFSLLIQILQSPQPVSFVKGEIKWILPLAAVFILTIPFSEMIMVSLKFSFINLLYIAVFYILLFRMFAQSPQLFVHMLVVYTLGLILVSIWGIYRFWQWEWNPVVIRGIFDPFYNDHTIYGASAALLAGWWLGSTFFSQNNTTRLLSFIAGITLLVFVMLSTSRAAFLSMLVFFTVFAALRLHVRWKHVAIVSGLFLAVLLLFRNPIADQIRQTTAISDARHSTLTERTRSVANVKTDVSNVERLNRWIAAWGMFRQKPLTGFGPGTYQFAYIPFQSKALENRLTVKDPYNVPEGSGGTAHSEYLLALSEMGFAGLAAWLIILFRWAHIGLTTRKDHPHRRMIIVAFAVLTTYYFHALFNNFLTTDKFAFLFWGTAAWMAALHRNPGNQFLQPAKKGRQPQPQQRRVENEGGKGTGFMKKQTSPAYDRKKELNNF